MSAFSFTVLCQKASGYFHAKTKCISETKNTG